MYKIEIEIYEGKRSQLKKNSRGIVVKVIRTPLG